MKPNNVIGALFIVLLFFGFVVMGVGIDEEDYRHNQGPDSGVRADDD